jgi:ParB family chromosome partitioning protein
MGKTFSQNAENASSFLALTSSGTDERPIDIKARTLPLRSARIIDINKIRADPNQPRKTINQESLESLAESISELDGIIDPITVEYIEKDDCYRIISGERRYRAAKIVGLVELPCVVKEVDDHNRFLMQFIANLQREDIQPLEEAAGIRQLVQSYGYNQLKVAKLLNKSKSYISQVLGLERLEEPAREIIRKASIPKEAQIQASRETDPAKQRDILIEASKDGNTVRQLRKDQRSKKRRDENARNVAAKSEDAAPNETAVFHEWMWESPDKGFWISIRFSKGHDTADKKRICIKALKAALASMEETTDPISPSSAGSDGIDCLPDDTTHE